MNDGRATATCSLGPLISAEIAAADSLQRNGLIKYRGSAELSGIYRPPLGQVVTFQYTMDGVTRTIPKKMRVISSFVDIRERITKVELGCLLTYKSDQLEPVVIDTELANTDYSSNPSPDNPWLQVPALAAAYPESWGNRPRRGTGSAIPTSYWQSSYKRVGASISAAWALSYCLTKLGIQASSIPLRNSFREQEMEFDGPWVDKISELLEAESYVGELDFNEVLQIRSLASDTGSGPIIRENDIISLGPIGAGAMPATQVRIKGTRWNAAKLPTSRAYRLIELPSDDGNGNDPYELQEYDPDGDPDDPLSDNEDPLLPGSGAAEEFATQNGGQNNWGSKGFKRDSLQEDLQRGADDQDGWTYSEQVGPETVATVNYKIGREEYTYTQSYTPVAVTHTRYEAVGETTFPLASGAAGGRVASKQITMKTSILSAEAPKYMAAHLSLGRPLADSPTLERVETRYTYDTSGRVFIEIKDTYKSAVAIAGSSNVPYAYKNQLLSIPSAYALLHAERVQTDYYYSKLGRAQVVTKWQNWMFTQPGQQAAAEVQNLKDIGRAREFLARVLFSRPVLVSQDTTYDLSVDSTDRENTVEGLALGPKKYRSSYPGATDVTNGELGTKEDEDESGDGREEFSVSLDMDFGGEDEDDDRVAEYELPLPVDDEISPVNEEGEPEEFEIDKSLSETLAITYGRVQNRMTYGYRNGMEIQMTPWKMPDHAFAPMYISFDGLVAQYRLNNPSWVIAPGEVVASANAIYWGVVGQEPV